MENELLKSASSVPQSGSSWESWHHPRLSDTRGCGRRCQLWVVTRLAEVGKGRRQVQPRAAGPSWGRVIYSRSGLHGGSQSPWEEVRPSGWPGAGEEERQRAQSPPPAPLALHSPPQLTLRRCAGSPDTSPPVTCVEQGLRQTQWGTRVRGSWQSSSTYPTWSISPYHWKKLFTFPLKRKFKISLHDFPTWRCSVMLVNLNYINSPSAG